MEATSLDAAAPDAAGRRDALMERLFAGVLGMIDVYAVYMGDRLGLYRALADGAATSAEVAGATGTHERYVREWLEQQAVNGLLEVEGGSGDGSARRYRLPAGHDEVLVQSDSPDCLAPFARMMVGMVREVPAVLGAFRSGGGVPYEAYDADFCDGQGDMNGAVFDALLGARWLPAIPDVHDRLQSDPPARVADVACGTGRSTIAIARAYPNALVDGIDLDRHSIEVARGNLAAEEGGLADRVTFDVRDAADPGLAGRYDLVTVFEAIHDLAKPVEVLRAMRGLLVEGGTTIVMDERVAEEFEAPGDDIERLMYGFSILHCLPVGMAEQPSAATGTVMRPAQLREYARAAGFAEMEVLPIENEFWRFYRLVP
jgi:2-polyprenyl-3-methyl-5-hydroxy-6-metoxy-1,4-benzoquinol methylase